VCADALRAQADEEPTKKSRSFRKFTFRGVDLDQLLDLNTDELVQLFHARARRRCVPSELRVRAWPEGAPHRCTPARRGLRAAGRRPLRPVHPREPLGCRL